MEVYDRGREGLYTIHNIVQVGQLLFPLYTIFTHLVSLEYIFFF